MNCPVCKIALTPAGRTVKCAQCDGAWVHEEVLVPLLEQSASTLVSLPWRPSGEDHVRACPVCNASMKTVALGSVALDHCVAHGVWFDAHELASLLGQAKSFRAEAAPEHAHHGLLSRIAKLFR